MKRNSICMRGYFERWSWRCAYFIPLSVRRFGPKKRANTINLLSWKPCYRYRQLFNSLLFSFKLSAADWLKKQQQKNLSRKSRLDSFVLPAPVTVVTLFRGTQRQFLENICSEDDLRSRIFGTFFVKFLACMPLLGFRTFQKWYNCPF